MSSTRPFVIPVFLPPAGDRGCLLDPPARAACGDVAKWVERVVAQVEAALAARPAAPRAPEGPAGLVRRSQIGFFGGSFGSLDPSMRAGLLAAVAPFLARRAVASLRVTLDPAHVDARILETLSAAGVGTVELDVGSFDDEALAACGLPWRAATAIAAAETVRGAGLELGIVLRPGMPGGTPTEVLRSGRRAAELRPSFVRLYPVLVLRGSPLAAAFEARLYRPLSLEEAVEITADLLRIFEEAEVAVGRVGFQPAVDLDGGGEVIAGPHHPSIRALAEARIWLERAMTLITAHFRFQRELTLVVAPVDESRLRGPQGANVKRLREKFRLDKLYVRAEESALPGSLAIASPTESQTVAVAVGNGIGFGPGSESDS